MRFNFYRLRMRAIRQYEFGPAENLHCEEAADPVPGPDQVRIAVRASGVHLIDTSIRSGTVAGPFPLPELPMTPGREVAGVVDAVGGDAGEAWVGRRVVAHLGAASGGYASVAVADVVSLHEIPVALDFDVAVAAIGTGRTAVGILDLAALTATDVVLVTAAAGGLGSLFVQAGRRAGAVVVGLAGGSDKTARVRAAGADHAVDYLRPDWPTRVREAVGTATVVLDGVGGRAGRAALELLGPGGRYLLHGYAFGTPTELTTKDLYVLGITASAAIGPRMLRRPGGLRELETRAIAEAAAGRLVPTVGHRFPLAEAAAAHAALESRATTGKVVLIP